MSNTKLYIVCIRYFKICTFLQTFDLYCWFDLFASIICLVKFHCHLIFYFIQADLTSIVDYISIVCKFSMFFIGRCNFYNMASVFSLVIAERLRANCSNRVRKCNCLKQCFFKCKLTNAFYTLFKNQSL